MADTSHLERMGRELNCPICLSLLNTAVSLPCNHVFCNLCIEKSMKSASACPVCKVPYRRREVRPAPHMDNLVSIYKGMEVASGVNIFVTQAIPSTKLPDEENQHQDGRICGRKESSRTCQGTLENRRFKRRQSKKLLKIDEENTNLDHVKPSFPTKKRVQVPKYPSSETPIQSAKIESGLVKFGKAIPEKSLVIQNEKPAVNDKGEPAFAPFFWLRDEEDVEKLSQQTDGDLYVDLYVTPPNAPCFSDIKDSDDESPSKMAPEGGTNITSHDANFFDSELFEWTQRPCSPELCSSPMEIQVADTDELLQEKESKLSIQGETVTGEHGVGNKENEIPKQSTENEEVKLTSLSSPMADRTNAGDRTTKICKRGRRMSERTKRKRAKKTTDEVLEVQVDSEKVADSNISEDQYKNEVNLLNSNKTTHKRDKVMFDSNAVEHVPGNVSALSIEASTLNLAMKTMVTDLSASSDEKESSRKCNARKERDGLKRSKTNITANLKYDQKQRSRKQKTSTNDISKDKLVNDIQNGCNNPLANDTLPSGFNSKIRDPQDSASIGKARPCSNGVILQKCDTARNKIQCAFCHSTEDSEASGVMVHYLNGKPVAADYNGGSKVIHAHRECTEWAPNVYFEDENAINLEAELARSRRIKCCCCDIKGAALGCYEKSCRKSFHVPCAKLIPHCRWDNDNFVILCPLHACSKLPNEMSGSSIIRKQKCVKKSPFQSYQQEVAVKHANSQCWDWSSCASAGKPVLCCSALAKEEKDIVSEFQRLSGVMVLKSWDASVTHVIASTYENGACKRTLKFLMGILEGKWILSIGWIKDSIKGMKLVDEQLYEIGVDVHGIRDGPRLGRLRILNKQPKLFNGCKFYFTGEFEPSYKGYLHDLVIAAGGTVLQRKPVSRDQESLSSRNTTSTTFIVYSLELPNKCDPNKRDLIINRRRSDAEVLASSTGAAMASNSWVLNSIAACKLQNLAD